jgi:hypothetical protein
MSILFQSKQSIIFEVQLGENVLRITASVIHHTQKGFDNFMKNLDSPENAEFIENLMKPLIGTSSICYGAFYGKLHGRGSVTWFPSTLEQVKKFVRDTIYRYYCRNVITNR